MSEHIIWDSLSPKQAQDVISMAVAHPTTGAGLVKLLRSPYGHYGAILDAAENYIEKLSPDEPRA